MFPQPDIDGHYGVISEFRKDWNSDSSSVIRVEIKEEPIGLKSFLVYPVSTNTYGNYLKKREGGTAYIVNIPGYSGDVGSLFVTSRKYWLPDIIYTYKPSDLREVKMIIPGEGDLSFKIVQDSLTSIGLFSYPEDTPVELFDTTKVLRYLSYFNHLRFEQFVINLDSAKMKEIMSSMPLHELAILDKSGGILNLKTWPITIKTEGKEEIDLNRIYGRINNGPDLVIIRYVDIDPVLKVKSYFVNKPGN